MIEDSMNRYLNTVNNVISEENLNKFLDYQGDCFAILQIRESSEAVNDIFRNYNWLESHNRQPNPENYNTVYTDAIQPNQNVDLDEIFRRFNIDIPKDFIGHSLSISDIIAIKQNNVIKYYYIDSIGFKELNNFTLKIGGR